MRVGRGRQGQVALPAARPLPGPASAASARPHICACPDSSRRVLPPAVQDAEGKKREKLERLRYGRFFCAWAPVHVWERMSSGIAYMHASGTSRAAASLRPQTASRTARAAPMCMCG